MDFLMQVADRLDLAPAEKAKIMRELRSHYLEIKDDSLASGMDEESAEAEAARRLGDPDDIASRLTTVHYRANWRSALLTALPLSVGPALLWTFYSLMSGEAGPVVSLGITSPEGLRWATWISGVLTAVFTIVILAGTFRALWRNSRPIWLATWLAWCVAAVVITDHLIRENVTDALLPTTLLLIAISQIVVIIVLAIWAFRASNGLRGTLFGIVLIGMGTIDPIPIPDPDMLLLSIPFGLGLMILKFAIVMNAFAWHPYGHVSQASLYLWGVWFALPQGSVMMTDTFVIWPVLAALVVVAYARMCTWQQRLAVLAIGVAAVSAIIALARDRTAAEALVHGGLLTLLMSGLMIGIPLILNRIHRAGRPEYARQEDRC